MKGDKFKIGDKVRYINIEGFSDLKPNDICTVVDITDEKSEGKEQAIYCKEFSGWISNYDFELVKTMNTISKSKLRELITDAWTDGHNTSYLNNINIEKDAAIYADEIINQITSTI